MTERDMSETICAVCYQDIHFCVCRALREADVGQLVHVRDWHSFKNAFYAARSALGAKIEPVGEIITLAMRGSGLTRWRVYQHNNRADLERLSLEEKGICDTCGEKSDWCSCAKAYADSASRRINEEKSMNESEIEYHVIGWKVRLNDVVWVKALSDEPVLERFAGFFTTRADEAKIFAEYATVKLLCASCGATAEEVLEPRREVKRDE